MRQNLGAIKWLHFFSLWPQEFKREAEQPSNKNLKTRVSPNPFQLVGDRDKAIKSKQNCPKRRLFKFNLIQDFNRPAFSHDNPINDLILASFFPIKKKKRIFRHEGIRKKNLTAKGRVRRRLRHTLRLPLEPTLRHQSSSICA